MYKPQIAEPVIRPRHPVIIHWKLLSKPGRGLNWWVALQLADTSGGAEIWPITKWHPLFVRCIHGTLVSCLVHIIILGWELGGLLGESFLLLLSPHRLAYLLLRTKGVKCMIRILSFSLVVYPGRFPKWSFWVMLIKCPISVLLGKLSSEHGNAVSRQWHGGAARLHMFQIHRSKQANPSMQIKILDSFRNKTKIITTTIGIIIQIIIMPFLASVSPKVGAIYSSFLQIFSFPKPCTWLWVGPPWRNVMQCLFIRSFIHSFWYSLTTCFQVC